MLRVVLALAFGTAPRAALPPTCTAKRHCPNAAIARKCASLARSPVVPVAPVRFPRSVHSRSAPLRRSLSTLLTAPCGPPRFARRRISPPLTYAPSTPYALTRCGRLRLAHARRYKLHVLPMVARVQNGLAALEEHSPAQGRPQAARAAWVCLRSAAPERGRSSFAPGTPPRLSAKARRLQCAAGFFRRRFVRGQTRTAALIVPAQPPAPRTSLSLGVAVASFLTSCKVRTPPIFR